MSILRSSELLFFGQAVQPDCCGSVSGDNMRDNVEIAGPNFALMRAITVWTNRKFHIPQSRVRRQSTVAIAAREITHPGVKRMKTSEESKQEFATDCAERLAIFVLLSFLFTLNDGDNCRTKFAG
jgi:hypothetical protein